MILKLFKITRVTRDSEGYESREFIQLLSVPDGTTEYDIVNVLREHIDVIVQDITDQIPPPNRSKR